MGYAFAAVAAFILLVAAFVWWRYTSVERGARQREAKIFPLLDPVMQKLAAGTDPTPEEIDDVAKKPFARYYLYQALKHYERLQLFPEEYRSEEAQAAAKLAFWMMHPNELQDAPAEMELVETVVREVDGKSCRFYVFRYLMPPGHWAGKEWEIGLVGPFIDNEPPYSDLPGAFCRGDKFEKVRPEELVDWFIGMVRTKSGVS